MDTNYLTKDYYQLSKISIIQCIGNRNFDNVSLLQCKFTIMEILNFYHAKKYYFTRIFNIWAFFSFFFSVKNIRTFQSNMHIYIRQIISFSTNDIIRKNIRKISFFARKIMNDALSRYHVPESFIICCNFWRQ